MNQAMNAEIRPLSDSALVVQLGDEVNPTVHRAIIHLSTFLYAHSFEGFVECVPAYLNLTVHYNPFIVHRSHQGDPTATPFQKVSAYIQTLLSKMDEGGSVVGRSIAIPVLYGDDHGPDLAYVANYHDLSIEEVIRIHSEKEYLVYMLGFAPGFPFIGGMSEQIATPRKETPRSAIAPGSVGIAGKQTGVYPLETPGGWQIIGQTPMNLFLPDQEPPALLQPGDTIRFQPISSEEFVRYKEEAE